MRQLFSAKSNDIANEIHVEQWSVVDRVIECISKNHRKFNYYNIPMQYFCPSYPMTFSYLVTHKITLFCLFADKSRQNHCF